jgi:hypothetical protein
VPLCSLFLIASAFMVAAIATGVEALFAPAVLLPIVGGMWTSYLAITSDIYATEVAADVPAWVLHAEARLESAPVAEHPERLARAA